MKKLFILIVLFSWDSLMNAQTDSTACHTITLQNGHEILAKIDSTFGGFLLYKKCDDTIGYQLRIPLSAIASVEDGNIELVSLKNQISEDVRLAEKTRRRSVNEWIFRHKIKKLEKRIAKGNRVRVFYRDDRNNRYRAVGNWEVLTKDALVLQTENVGVTQTIHKKNITKIQLLKKDGVGKRLSGSLMIILAVGILAVLFIALIIAAFSAVLSGGVVLPLVVV